MLQKSEKGAMSAFMHQGNVYTKVYMNKSTSIVYTREYNILCGCINERQKE